METVPNRRVALIGPLPPLRGGIARHTASLRKALERRAELLTVSYHRTYPRWLYPGSDLHEPEWASANRDAGLARHDLDALDPRTWGDAVRAIARHGAAQAVIPWWTVALAPPTLAIARGCRRHRVPVTFLCHNVVDHEGAGWKRWLTRRILARGDRFVAASGAEADRLRELLPGADPVVHPHPVYDAFPAPDRPLQRRAVRELLFFGLIRPYKGLDLLIEALASHPADDWRLTIAGEPWQDIAPLRDRARAAGIDDRIEWVDRYVSAAEAGAFFQRADAIVLPYRRASGCGVLAQALGSGRPVIVSDLPGLREQVAHGETGWLVPAGDAAAFADAILHVDADAARSMEPAVRRMAGRWTWDSLADAVLGHG